MNLIKPLFRLGRRKTRRFLINGGSDIIQIRNRRRGTANFYREIERRINIKVNLLLRRNTVDTIIGVAGACLEEKVDLGERLCALKPRMATTQKEKRTS